MDNENKKQKPWRILVGIAAIGWIVYMWVKKDIVTIYSTMPKDHVFPMIVTTIAVTLAKVVLISALILLVRWIIGKIKNGKK